MHSEILSRQLKCFLAKLTKLIPALRSFTGQQIIWQTTFILLFKKQFEVVSLKSKVMKNLVEFTKSQQEKKYEANQWIFIT